MDGPERLGIPALVVVGLEHVVDERDPLAPVVKGGELADHRDDGVRMTDVVGRRQREPFDLANDVVAEITDETAMKGWQPLDRR